MESAKYHMIYIVTNSKLKFGIIFVLTITLMIATAILGSNFSNSIFAFSNKYSTQERYDSGVKDGKKDCLNGSNTSAYQQSGAYLGHSKYYQQGYDDTVANCGGGGNTGHGNNNYGYNDGTLYSDSHDKNQAQGQVSNQKPLCVTVFGSCNTTSGQAQTPRTK
jgi:hypothetical protein